MDDIAMNGVRDANLLSELQALPLGRKIQISQARIIEWYQYWGGKVVISFSGGKDSTVLLHLVRQLYPDVPAVFSNTGLEYPEIVRFAHSIPNVDVVTPKMRFTEVISTYGYPLIGKEVAEAIYYARRIREQNLNCERNLERRRCEMSVDRVKDGFFPRGQVLSDNSRGNRPSGFAEAERRRLDLTVTRESDKNVRRRGPVGKYPHKEGFVPEDGQKSQFNKDRYLPLVNLPIPISHYCCRRMKKQPMSSYLHKVGKHPYLGILAEESRLRKAGWIKTGCNIYESRFPQSHPLSFWTEQDILTYILQNRLEIAKVYGEIVCEDVDGNQYPARDMLAPCGKLSCSGCNRTGCIFCAFGFHAEKGETRFQRLAKSHPKQYEYALGGGQWADNPAYDPTAPKYDGDWENWNPKQIWVPSKQGLGMRKVFDMVNELYGKGFYRYE